MTTDRLWICGASESSLIYSYPERTRFLLRFHPFKVIFSHFNRFPDQDLGDLFEKITNVKYNFDAPIWKVVSADSISFIKSFLLFDPSLRMTGIA